MIIFKSPMFAVCTCERCGTVFQPEPSDHLEYRFADRADFENFEVFTDCPTCEKYCKVIRICETDINEGHKPDADIVQVVRCRDCKHFTEGMTVGICYRIEDKPLIPCVYNHYCSYGERRERTDCAGNEKDHARND